MSSKKRGKQNAVEQHTLPGVTSAVAAVIEEDMHSSFVPNPQIILDLEHQSNRRPCPQYPSLEIDGEGRDGVPAQQIMPITPPMMPWAVHLSKADMNGLGNSPVDQEQRRALEMLSEDTLSYIETTSDGRSSIGSNDSFAKLYTLGVQWWRDDHSRTLVDFPEIAQVSGSNPYRCLHGKCSTKVKVFTCPSALRKHLAFHIPPGLRPFVCLECPIDPVRRDFVLPKDLVRHFREKHKEVLNDFSGEKPKPHLESAECDVCEIAFTRTGGLQRHQDKFKGTCGGSRKRSRRKSTPAVAGSSGRTTLAALVDQPMSQAVGSHRLPTSTTTSSLNSGSSRPSGQRSHRQRTASTATGMSVHLSPDMVEMSQAAELLPDASHLMSWCEGYPSGY